MVKKTEAELRDIANILSDNITIRTYDEFGSVDTKRETTLREKEILYKLIYGALFGFNWGNNTEEGAQAIADAMETTLTQFISDANGYLSIYCPLKEAFKLWEE